MYPEKNDHFCLSIGVGSFFLLVYKFEKNYTEKHTDRETERGCQRGREEAWLTRVFEEETEETRTKQDNPGPLEWSIRCVRVLLTDNQKYKTKLIRFVGVWCSAGCVFMCVIFFFIFPLNFFWLLVFCCLVSSRCPANCYVL